MIPGNRLFCPLGSAPACGLARFRSYRLATPCTDKASIARLTTHRRTARHRIVGSSLARTHTHTRTPHGLDLPPRNTLHAAFCPYLPRSSSSVQASQPARAQVSPPVLLPSPLAAQRPSPAPPCRRHITLSSALARGVLSPRLAWSRLPPDAPLRSCDLQAQRHTKSLTCHSVLARSAVFCLRQGSKPQSSVPFDPCSPPSFPRPRQPSAHPVLPRPLRPLRLVVTARRHPRITDLDVLAVPDTWRQTTWTLAPWHTFSHRPTSALSSRPLLPLRAAAIRPSATQVQSEAAIQGPASDRPQRHTPPPPPVLDLAQLVHRTTDDRPTTNDRAP